MVKKQEEPDLEKLSRLGSDGEESTARLRAIDAADEGAERSGADGRASG